MKHFMGSIALIFLFMGCELQSFDDFECDPYDGELEWTEVAHQAGWPARYGHAAVAFNNTLWITGGYNPGKVKGDTYLEDVWSSVDGEQWSQVTDSAPWKGRRGHQLVVFDDGNGEAMFLIGGFRVDETSGFRSYTNDVWRSTNGSEWEEIKPSSSPDPDANDDWYPRYNHSVVVARHNNINYIYIIGGACMLTGVEARYSMQYFNDVWRSTDGITWNRLLSNDFGIRSEASAAFDPQTGRIYIQGGIHGVIFESQNGQTHPIQNWEKVWYSTDGEVWEMDSASGFDEALLWRSDHEMVWYKNKIWTLPGKTTSNAHYHFTQGNQYPMWTIDAEGDLKVDSYGCDMDPRHGYATAVLNEKIFIMGGFTSSHGQSSDVWSAVLK